MPLPAISVVVPTFNAGKTIRRCLQSVVEQSLKAVEVLVVDGRSTDDTVAIAGEFAQRHPTRVRLVCEPDKGVYDAMNKGITLTRAPWLYFLGGDDWLHGARVLEDVEPHLRAESDFVYGNVFRVSRGSTEGGPFDDARLFQQNICHQGIFYRRGLLDVVGNYQLEFPICADWDLNLRCFAATRARHHIDMTICNYDGSGMSSRITDIQFYERKLELIAQHYMVSFSARLFRSCRFDFHARARQLLGTRQLVPAARYYLLYCMHGALARMRL